MKLIALAGPKGTGKSTLANVLGTTHGFRRFSFAQPLRDMIKVGLGIDCNEMTAAQKEQPIDWLNGVSARRLLQTLGTEWGRDTICADLWIRTMQRSLLGAERLRQRVVIDDVRFPNEAELVHSMGGQLYLLERIEHDSGFDTHISEAGYQDLPHIHQKLTIPRRETQLDMRVLYSRLADMLVVQCPPTK